MNFSLALMNLLVGVSLAISNADDSALVRDRLERNIAINGIIETEPNQLRRLNDVLNTDFSHFVGSWYDCLHTTLMTFNGQPADKHIVDQVGCDFGLLGDISNVGNNQQTLQFDIFLLNHCFFHDLGGPGQEPCPNDLLSSDVRGDGNVLVKYSFSGIGSFTDSNKIEFVSDHTFLRDSDGEWVANLDRAKIENADTMVCQKYAEGIVCDWRINEYRSISEEGSSAGCKKGGKCKSSSWGGEKKCNNKGGEWTEECAEIIFIKDGFVYDSFGSYYLVKDTSDCTVECATDSPTETGQTLSPELKISGCYFGGRCEETHGCCDCEIKTEDACTTNDVPGQWSSDCRDICLTDTPPVDTVLGCYHGGRCFDTYGCCDCLVDTEDECTNGEFPGIFIANGECAPICYTE